VTFGVLHCEVKEYQFSAWKSEFNDLLDVLFIIPLAYAYNVPTSTALNVKSRLELKVYTLGAEQDYP